MKSLNIKDFLHLKSEILIDVRSPSEFAHSHIPNAINLPVLSDKERVEVGTLYKRDSFGAKVLGASYISQNIGRFLREFEFSPKQILKIYCARGGMRSLALQDILSHIGYRTARLENGFKAYRNFALEFLNSENIFKNMRFLTLTGPTGSGKSEILRIFEQKKSDFDNLATLDLENLANHFGSSFGSFKGLQPTQAHFQNLLFDNLCNAQNKIIITESESKKIGNLILPTHLYNAYQNAPKIFVQTSFENRVARILNDYKNMDFEFFNAAMQKISPFMKKEFWLQCFEHFKRGDFAAVAEILLKNYYDKCYKKDNFDFVINADDVRCAVLQISQIAQNIKGK